MILTKKRLYWFTLQSCKCKAKHSSMKSALRSLLKNRENGISVDAVYKCPVCGFYHIGHWGKKSTRKANRRIIREVLKRKEIKCL